MVKLILSEAREIAVLEEAGCIAARAKDRHKFPAEVNIPKAVNFRSDKRTYFLITDVAEVDRRLQ